MDAHVAERAVDQEPPDGGGETRRQKCDQLPPGAPRHRRRRRERDCEIGDELSLGVVAEIAADRGGDVDAADEGEQAISFELVGIPVGWVLTVPVSGTLKSAGPRFESVAA